MIGSLLLAFAVWTGLAFMGGAAFIDFIRPSILSLTGTTSPRDAVSALVGAPGRFASAWLADEEIPRLHVDIKFKHLHKLHRKRDEAIATGLLQSSSDDFVPAEIRILDETVRVKLRLKGDYTDHLKGEKWSMRIHVRKGEQLFGMRRLSLQAPNTRAFQAEPVVLDQYRREGVLAPRYFFVHVSINGNDIGLMAVEESFSKELLESNRRREGVIVRFHEDAYFANVVRNGIHGPYENFYVARIKPFGSSAIEKSPLLGAQNEIAISMLRGFLDGRLAASAVFDVDQISRFLAVSEVWGARHALSWHNLRFYLNPITLRLEPIAFDINMQVTYVGTGLVSLYEPFSALLLEDPSIRSGFVTHLRRLAENMRAGRSATEVAAFEAPMLRVLNLEFPLRGAMQVGRLENRAALLASVTNESFDLFRPAMVRPQAEYPDAIQAFIQSDGTGDYLEFINILPVPVRIESLVDATANEGKGKALALGSPLGLPIELSATPVGGRPLAVRVGFEAPTVDATASVTDAEPLRVEGTYRVEGQRRRHPFEARAYVAAAPQHPIDVSTRAQVLERHSFLGWDEALGRLRAASGEHRVSGSIVLPAGEGLQLDAGTTLRFSEGEALIGSGPLIFQGSAASPVVLQAMDAESLWSGIVSLRSDEPHEWKHVVVRQTSGIARGGWVLTGGVTLREATVRIEDSLFESNRCEDALNLIRSEFDLINVRFVDTPSDAFDGDFVSGRVVGGSFEDIGGDGIDVSGARIEIDGVHLSRVHDKALSLGERSQAKISNVRVEGAGTAIASKDASRTEVSKSEFVRIAYTAIMAYVKKPEYGPSQIFASDIILREVGSEALAQLGSRVTLNGVEIVPEAIDIEALYEEGHMRK